MRDVRTKLVLVLLATLGAVPCAGVDLRGRIELLQKGGNKPCKGCDVTEAIVYFEPAAAVRPPAVESFEIAMEDKKFVPRVSAVPRGSTVRFPNHDPILHNVFSVSKGNAFDLGLYRGEKVEEAVLEAPGVVRVFCNVHSTMVAYVLVLETPYVTSPAADGTFMLSGLPSGPGKLTVWHERGDPQTLDLLLPQTSSVSVTIEALRPQVPDHLNKLGRPYARSRRDDYQ